MSHCRSCGASVRWARTISGKAMPLNAQPTSAGNIVLHDTGDPNAPQTRVLAGADLFDARNAGTTLYVSHFSSCPEAGKWRR